MSGGQQPVTQQTTQTRDPWIGAQPALNQVQAGASALFNSGQGYAPYSGPTQTPLDPNVAGAIGLQRAINTGNLYGTPGVQAAQATGLNMIQNQGLSPELRSLYQQAQGNQNPYLQSILDTSNRRIGDRVNASMSGAGRYGSGQHTDVMARALAESADPILAQDYARRQQQQQDILTGGLSRAGQWAQLMPSLDQAQLQPAQNLMALGEYEQNRSQIGLADQIRLYNAQQAYPWEQLARYSAVASGAGGLGGSQVTSSPLQQPSTLQSGLGGALSGAGLGSIFGPAGAGVGALGGGLLGLLR